MNNGTCYVDFSTSNYTFFCVCPIPKQYEGKDYGTPSKNTITTISTTATAPSAAAAANVTATTTIATTITTTSSTATAAAATSANANINNTYETKKESKRTKCRQNIEELKPVNKTMIAPMVIKLRGW